MESNKIGSGLTSALSQTSTIKKNTKAQKVESDGSDQKRVDQKEDFNVALSDKARVMAESRAKALEIARNTPDIREDRVTDIKKRIAQGEYEVDSEKIADGILREAIRDELAKSPL